MASIAIPKEQEALEAKVQEAAIAEHKWRGRPGTMLVHVPNQGADRANKHRRMALARQGLRSGFPDLLVIGPRAGQTRFIEVKRGGKAGRTPDDGQRAWHIKLRAAGFETQVCYGVDDLLATLEVWGILRPDRSVVRGAATGRPAPVPPEGAAE